MALKEKSPAPKPDDTVLLELALYSNYTWQGESYEKGKAYRFRQADAMALLGKEDFGRPVWRVYHPPVKKLEAQNLVVDATSIASQPEAEPIHGVAPPKPKRIDVGTDEEIADVLNRPDSGDVTV